MKLISWNVNGLRAAERKGFEAWFRAEQADVLCLQEIKAFPAQLGPFAVAPPGYSAHFRPALRPGYSGVATYSKALPRSVVYGMDLPESDDEGRILVTRFEDFTLVNTYMPHSRRDLSRLAFKNSFGAHFLDWVRALAAEGPPLIICGDYNIAHTEIDLTHARANRKNAGFLPEERAWMDDLLALGLVDIFRETHPGEAGHHTWWSNRKGVREKNVGWRIDYFCISRALVPRVVRAAHLSDVYGSDHCPVLLELA